jgi:uncharacterized OsmC-like protein
MTFHKQSHQQDNAKSKEATMGEVKSSSAQTIGISGRYLVEADGRIFVSDSAAIRTENSLAPEPTHFLLSALGVCVLGSVEKEANQLGIPVPHGDVSVTSVRDEEDQTRFSSIQIDVVLKSITQDLADKLVGHFTSHCPIYNTIRRGGPISVSVSVAP